MAEVASAFVSLVPSARGFGRGTERQVGPELAGAGKRMGRTLGRTMFTAAAAVGAAVGIGHLFSDSIGEAREAQKVGALTEQVIKSTGGAAKVTAKQIGKLSTAISNKVGIDDEQIQSGANMLLTFKNIRNEAGKNNKIFDQATQITTDMAASMAAASGGEIDLKSSSIQVGKALNDPIKGITALSRVGVTFTQGQKDQIKALVESGDTLSAQKIILRELKSEFGGAAASMATDGDKAKVALGNLKETIGTALLPAIDGLARLFTNKLAPAMTTFVENIGPAAGKVKAFFTNGAGHAALAKSMGIIGKAAGAVKEGFGQAADSLAKIKDAADGLDLGNLDGRKIGESLGTAFVEALKFLGKNVGQITKTLGDLFAKVDWVGIGIAIGRQAPALLIGLAAGILNFDFGSLVKGIGDHWFDILIGLLTLAFAPSKFIGPLERILTRIPFVGRFLAAAVRWVNDLGGKLTKFGGDLFRAFAEGFGRVRFPGAGLVSRVMGAFRALPGHVADFFKTLETRIGVWALDAFGAAGRGARTALGRLLTFVGSIPGRIVKALGSLGSLLFNAGRELISGLISGILSKLGDLGGAMGKVASKVKGFLPGSPVKEGPLTSWNNGGAGKRLVDLLAVGLQDTHAVDAAMNRLTGRISVASPTASIAAVGAGSSGLVDAEQATYRAMTRALGDNRLTVVPRTAVDLGLVGVAG